ncbi:MAG: T9SS type A sorting domain-containing protein [Cryomorphaceae bacterium]|nr:T9SS type A sorting domain-containing protein [Flavobacteriales bacterium]
MSRIVKNFTLAAALLTGLSAFGQNWNTDSLRWNVLSNFGYISESFLAESILINDTSYRSIYYLFSCNDLMPEIPTLTGYVRQEGEQVYFRTPGANHEMLLYDFSLQPGDLMPAEFCGVGGKVVVNQFGAYEVFVVDSVPTLSGWRKRIRFGAFDWIEGFGSTRGPLEYGVDNCATDLYLNLQCARSGESILYQDSEAPACCFNSLSADDETQARALYIAPNPVDRGGSVRLFGPATFAEAVLYDTAGRILSRWNWQKGQSFYPSSVGLGTGLYILQLKNGSQYSAHKLIVR